MEFPRLNPADKLKQERPNDPMWDMFTTFGQKANVEQLKNYVYDLIQLATQKDAGQRGKKGSLSFNEDLDMTLWGIVIEATALVLSGELDKIEGHPAGGKA